MFGFLKRKPKASEDTKVFFACYQSDKRSTTTHIVEPVKTQTDKFHERYKSVDLLTRWVDQQQFNNPNKRKENSTQPRSGIRRFIHWQTLTCSATNLERNIDYDSCF